MAEEPGVKSKAEMLVLVIEDDPSVAELLAHIVKREGFQAETAADGEEGINKVLKLRPDLVVLDLMLPKYGGFEILRQLQVGEMAGLPIVVVTGRYTDSSTAEMIRQESNVVEFMVKPVNPQVLGMALHRILKTQPPTGA